MNMRCATVKICGKDDSYIVINESDFDSKIHKVYKEPAKKTAPKKATKTK